MEIREGTTFYRFKREGSLYTILINPKNGRLDITFKDTTNPDKIHYCRNYPDEDYFRSNDTVLASYPYKEGDYSVKLQTGMSDHNKDLPIGSIFKIGEVAGSSHYGYLRVNKDDGKGMCVSYCRPAFSDEIPKSIDVISNETSEYPTYVEIIQDFWPKCHEQYQKGKIYEAYHYLHGTDMQGFINKDKVKDGYNKRFFKLSTKEAYDNQFVKKVIMKEKILKIGDRVSVNGQESAIRFSGQIGIIRHINSGSGQVYCVEFDSKFHYSLWNPPGITSSRGYQVTDRSLTLINGEDMNEMDKMIEEKEMYSGLKSTSLNKAVSLTSVTDISSTVSNIKPRSRKVGFISSPIKATI